MDSRRLLIVVFFSCVAIEIALFVLDWKVNHERGSSIGAIRRLFNTTREDSLASWFGVTQTFVVALVLWLTTAIAAKTQPSRWKRVGWIVLAVFFTYMAIDDGAKIHERLGTASKSFAVTKDAVGIYPSYAWQVVFMPLFAAMGLFMLIFLWQELPRTKDRVRVFLALSCFGVAVVFDFFEGLDDGYAWLIEELDVKKRTIRHYSKSIEETIEMLGMTILLVTFLDNLMQRARVLTVRFR